MKETTRFFSALLLLVVSFGVHADLPKFDDDMIPSILSAIRDRYGYLKYDDVTYRLSCSDVTQQTVVNQNLSNYDKKWFDPHQDMASGRLYTIRLESQQKKLAPLCIFFVLSDMGDEVMD